MAGRDHQAGQPQLPQRVFRHRCGIRVHHNRRSRTLPRNLPTLVRAMRLAGKPGSITVCILAALTVLVRHQRPLPVVHPSDVLNDYSVHGTFPRNSYGARAAEPPAQARHLLPAWRGPVGGCGVDRGYRRRHPCCGWVRYFLMTCIGLSSCHVVTLPLQ